MLPSDAARNLDEITRDLDLVVFKLEQPPPAEASELLAERKRLRRELERLKDRIEVVARALD